MQESFRPRVNRHAARGRSQYTPGKEVERKLQSIYDAMNKDNAPILWDEAATLIESLPAGSARRREWWADGGDQGESEGAEVDSSRRLILAGGTE